jgi:2-polyprenyl-3-methyl-5-hydroxy-6-metoxy-1,4-benzoquinol methylase
MPNGVPRDKSNGYDQIAEEFISRRNLQIGPATVRAWSLTLPSGTAILDLGCGHGIPISQVLIKAGFPVYGLDASPKMIAAFRRRFPAAQAECSPAEDSAFFGRTFDAVIAWGLIFLLPTEVQEIVIRKVAHTLNRGGKFLFTSPPEAVAWTDTLTQRESISIGAEAYQQILTAEGLALDGVASDEGGNYYYFVSKPY